VESIASAFLSKLLTSTCGTVDVRNIISDDDSLHEGVLPALKEYNLTQFMTVDVPGTDHQARSRFGALYTKLTYELPVNRQRGCAGRGNTRRARAIHRSSIQDEFLI
jgi:hypothetical protein